MFSNKSGVVIGKKIGSSGGGKKGITKKANVNANKSFASTNYTRQGGKMSQMQGESRDDYGIGYQNQ